ncbi:MAG: FAD-dependent oxidoreductase [Bradyrhizobiaceae bacterium]|nr:MAG: FAD-dependent oxidoreductase [Bradyrhizobiaceae bacterium]
MRQIEEPARQIPVLLDVDIVVVGGGTTGPLAAIAAARQNKRVVLIERFGSLGGNLTLGLNTKPSGALLGGLPLEIWNLARSTGAAGADYIAKTKTGGVNIASPCDPEIMKMLLTRLCADSGVQILFETLVSRPVMEGNTVVGVVIENKSGRSFIGAKVVIDCSADGDVAAAAGAPFIMGSGEKGEDLKMQPVGMYFTMADVDLIALSRWARTTDDIPAQAIPDDDAQLDYGLWLTGFNKTIQAYKKETGITLPRENITLKTANGLMYVNATRVLDVDVFSPTQFSDAVIECYRQIDEYAAFLIKKVPGFEKSRIAQIAPVLGVRETRHIEGEYTLTTDDVMHGTPFEDTIAVDVSAFDVHAPKGEDVDFQGLKPYEIPYRCMVPKGVEQLLVAGRCISADHGAHGRSRNMPACMATGQAAGIAASIAVGSNTTVRHIPVENMQSILKSIGMPLRPADLASP